MHDNVRLGGFVWVAVVGFIVVAALLALAVIVSTWRRSRRADRGAVPRWYAIVEAVYLATLLLAQFTPRFQVGLGAAAVLLTPVALGVGVAYLLRVVYPKAATAVPAESAPLDDAARQTDGDLGA